MKDYFKLRKQFGITERVHYAFDTNKAAKLFSSKVDAEPINIVKVGTGKYYVVELEPHVDKKGQEKAAKIAIAIGLSESYQQQLSEAKVSVAKLKPGLKVNVFHSGPSARNYGIKDENVYGGKVQVLGVGNVPYGKPATARHVIAKDYKDAQKKFRDVWNTEEIRYGHFYNALSRMAAFFQAIAAESDGKKVPYGHTCWIWKIIEGPNKGKISYCFISNDDKWEVVYLNKRTEFRLES